MYIHSICAHFLYYIIHIKIKILWCFELQMSKNTLNSLKQARILLKSLKWAKIPHKPLKIYQNTLEISKMTKTLQNLWDEAKIPQKPLKWQKYP